ncbi:unnamed protein product, partial [Sphacelaria rigidula]
SALGWGAGVQIRQSPAAGAISARQELRGGSMIRGERGVREVPASCPNESRLLTDVSAGIDDDTCGLQQLPLCSPSGDVGESKFRLSGCVAGGSGDGSQCKSDLVECGTGDSDVDVHQRVSGQDERAEGAFDVRKNDDDDVVVPDQALAMLNAYASEAATISSVTPVGATAAAAPSAVAPDPTKSDNRIYGHQTLDRAGGETVDDEV